MFDPQKYLTSLKGRDYLEVKWRLRWLRDEHPDAKIETNLEKYGPGEAIFKATIQIPSGGSATGWGSEEESHFEDWLEKAETRSIGRALAALGYGTQFAVDYEELPAPCDSPIKPKQQPPTPNTSNAINTDQTERRQELTKKRELLKSISELACSLEISIASLNKDCYKVTNLTNFREAPLQYLAELENRMRKEHERRQSETTPTAQPTAPMTTPQAQTAPTRKTTPANKPAPQSTTHAKPLSEADALIAKCNQIVAKLNLDKNYLHDRASLDSDIPFSKINDMPLDYLHAITIELMDMLEARNLNDAKG